MLATARRPDAHELEVFYTTRRGGCQYAFGPSRVLPDGASPEGGRPSRGSRPGGASRSLPSAGARARRRRASPQGDGRRGRGLWRAVCPRALPGLRAARPHPRRLGGPVGAGRFPAGRNRAERRYTILPGCTALDGTGRAGAAQAACPEQGRRFHDCRRAETESGSGPRAARALEGVSLTFPERPRSCPNSRPGWPVRISGTVATRPRP